MRNPLLAIQMQSRGIKCDAPGCDHNEEAELTSATIRLFTGKPCPKCGANLLTEADAENCRMLRRVTLGINIVAFPFMLLTLPFTLISILRKRTPVYRVKMNGTGEMEIEKKGMQ